MPLKPEGAEGGQASQGSSVAWAAGSGLERSTREGRRGTPCPQESEALSRENPRPRPSFTFLFTPSLWNSSIWTREVAGPEETVPAPGTPSFPLVVQALPSPGLEDGGLLVGLWQGVSLLNSRTCGRVLGRKPAKQDPAVVPQGLSSLPPSKQKQRGTRPDPGRLAEGRRGHCLALGSRRLPRGQGIRMEPVGSGRRTSQEPGSRS